MPEWLAERGIGETRMVRVEDDRIVEARILLEGIFRAGTVLDTRLVSSGSGGRNAVARSAAGKDFLLPRGAPGIAEGGTLRIEVTREAIPGGEPWKRPLARLTDKAAAPAPEPEAEDLPYPAPNDRLGALGWDDLIEEARSGIVPFSGGELRVFATPAMTLIDVDGYLPADELAVFGAAAAAIAILRLDIGGSIGIDLPTTSGKEKRQQAVVPIDTLLPKPFERTAVNGFGLLQIVRPRRSASLIELARDRAGFEARALLRRASFSGPGAKTLVAAPSVIAVIEAADAWLGTLERQLGGVVGLRPDPSLTISAGHVETR